jgi:hypothetical protein
MGGLNEPNVPDALRAVTRKRRASAVLPLSAWPLMAIRGTSCKTGLK